MYHIMIFSSNIHKPSSAKLNNLNFHPLDVVTRYRDPQFKWVNIIHICFI